MPELEISKIRTDGGTQPRAKIDDLTVSEYGNAMREGDTFPAVEVFFDGENYWLADGFHRLAAAKWIRAKIEVNIHQGSLEDAILYSAGANATHGLRRSNEDKRRSVERLLSHTEWSQWSDSEIARRCKVSHTFVGTMRKEITCNVAGDTSVLYQNRWGGVSKMDVSSIVNPHVSPRDQMIKNRWGCRACAHCQHDQKNYRTFFCLALARSIDYEADDKGHKLSMDCQAWKFNGLAQIVHDLEADLKKEKIQAEQAEKRAEFERELAQENDLLFGSKPEPDNPHSGPVHLRPHIVAQMQEVKPEPAPVATEGAYVKQLRLELVDAEKQLDYWTAQVQELRNKIEAGLKNERR